MPPLRSLVVSQAPRFTRPVGFIPPSLQSSLPKSTARGVTFVMAIGMNSRRTTIQRPSYKAKPRRRARVETGQRQRTRARRLPQPRPQQASVILRHRKVRRGSFRSSARLASLHRPERPGKRYPTGQLLFVLRRPPARIIASATAIIGLRIFMLAFLISE